MIPLPEVWELQDPETVPIKAEEAREQARLVAALRRTWSKIEDLAHRPIIYHCANGGSRNKIEAASLKTQGVLAGVPDLEIALPKGRTFRIEMKAMKGKLSSSQIEVIHHLERLGHQTIIAYSAEDALLQLTEELN